MTEKNDLKPLMLVPTPIGNLEDITLRALRVLRSVDVILAEDTRITKRLLKHFHIEKPVQSYHAHNEHDQIEKLIMRMKAGEHMALVSDAGTPGISDPGFLLVRACLQAQLEVECLPGPTAFVPALVQSGLPSDRFVFEGFLPVKKGRKSRLEALSQEDRTLILYESPHRLIKTLREIADVFGSDRPIAIAREISKFFGETVRGSVEDVIREFLQRNKESLKGEFVIVIAGSSFSEKLKRKSMPEADLY